MTLRHVLIGLNLVAVAAIVAYLIWAVLSPKHTPEAAKAANLTPFLPDEDLESRRLERVQGWALLFAAVVAVALPLYWLHEPARQKESATYFDKNAATRGEVLFSNATMPEFDSAVSIQCATCHGAKGQGGPVPWHVAGQPVAWKAPPLNTVLQRFTEDPKCVDPDIRATLACSVTDIITFGRPGTPMQAWGVAGGGSKNDQSIQDLIAYLRTIQLTPAQAQKQAKADLESARQQPQAAIDAAQTALDADKKSLETATSALQKAFGDPGASDADLTSACDQLVTELASDPKKVDRKQGLACRTFGDAVTTVKDDQHALDWTKDWAKRRKNVSDGQLLFELNCARCHTAGWSTFDPTIPAEEGGGADSLGLPGGGGGLGGGIGFNLRDGGEIRRFGSDESGGFLAQVQFVSDGSLPFKEYGTGGAGSGRMPGFGKMLTKDMIKEIVGYERYCVDSSTFTDVEPACVTTPRADPTTTTTAKG